MVQTSYPPLPVAYTPFAPLTYTTRGCGGAESAVVRPTGLKPPLPLPPPPPTLSSPALTTNKVVSLQEEHDHFISSYPTAPPPPPPSSCHARPNVATSTLRHHACMCCTLNPNPNSILACALLNPAQWIFVSNRLHLENVVQGGLAVNPVPKSRVVGGIGDKRRLNKGQRLQWGGLFSHNILVLSERRKPGMVEVVQQSGWMVEGMGSLAYHSGGNVTLQICCRFDLIWVSKNAIPFIYWILIQKDG